MRVLDQKMPLCVNMCGDKTTNLTGLNTYVRTASHFYPTCIRYENISCLTPTFLRNKTVKVETTVYTLPVYSPDKFVRHMYMYACMEMSTVSIYRSCAPGFLFWPILFLFWLTSFYHYYSNSHIMEGSRVIVMFRLIVLGSHRFTTHASFQQ